MTKTWSSAASSPLRRRLCIALARSLNNSPWMKEIDIKEKILQEQNIKEKKVEKKQTIKNRQFFEICIWIQEKPEGK